MAAMLFNAVSWLIAYGPGTWFSKEYPDAIYTSRMLGPLGIGIMDMHRWDEAHASVYLFGVCVSFGFIGNEARYSVFRV